MKNSANVDFASKFSVHRTHDNFLRSDVQIALIGAGGNGCQMLHGLARLNHAMLKLGHPFGLHVTLWDPDQVSEANIGRQLFAPSEIGAYKSAVLIQRVNAFFGTAWKANYNRFPMNTYNGFGRQERAADMLISCVDTAKARREIHHKLMSKPGHMRRTGYWLDLANEKDYGQVVLGEPLPTFENTKGDSRLPCVTELFPELLDENFVESDTPSCSLAEALQKQSLFINQDVATFALDLLAKLFLEGFIENHGAFINLRTGYRNPIVIGKGGGK